MKSLAKSLSKPALKLELEHFGTEIKIAMSWGWNAARGSSRMPRRTQAKQNIRSLWGQLQTHGGSEFHGPKPYTFQQMRWKHQVPNPLWPQGEEMRRSNQLIFDVSAGFGWRFEVKCWSAKRSFNLTPACHNQNICQKCHRTSGAETEKLYKIKCFNDSSCHSSEILFGMVSEGASG